jgi:dTDP-glucose 4,6-dehydratase
MERTVITGGAGFLGSHLCDYFIDRGHEVICIDNLITGDPGNIAHLFGNERFRFIKHDVTDFIHVNGKIDNILHFASPASPIDYLKLPIHTLKVGSLGTHKALGLAKAKRAKFLLASTSECYGDPLEHPQSEDYWGHVNPVGPRGVYDEAKRFAEAMTMAYSRHEGISTRIVRIFNTYGPRMRREDGRALPTFMRQALTGENITIFGDGKQTRSFCHVDDLVRGIYLLLQSEEVYPVNLGNPEEITVGELVEKIIRVCGTRSRVVYEDLPEDDPKVRRPDISKAKRVLGWEPQIKIDEGLRLVLGYFREKTTKCYL